MDSMMLLSSEIKIFSELFLKKSKDFKLKPNFYLRNTIYDMIDIYFRHIENYSIEYKYLYVGFGFGIGRTVLKPK